MSTHDSRLSNAVLSLKINLGLSTTRVSSKQLPPSVILLKILQVKTVLQTKRYQESGGKFYSILCNYVTHLIHSLAINSFLMSAIFLLFIYFLLVILTDV